MYARSCGALSDGMLPWAASFSSLASSLVRASVRVRPIALMRRRLPVTGCGGSSRIACQRPLASLVSLPVPLGRRVVFDCAMVGPSRCSGVGQPIGRPIVGTSRECIQKSCTRSEICKWPRTLGMSGFAAIFQWSGRRESNPQHQLGKLKFYH